MKLYLRKNPDVSKYTEATDTEIVAEAVSRVRRRGLDDLADRLINALVAGALFQRIPEVPMDSGNSPASRRGDHSDESKQRRG